MTPHQTMGTHNKYSQTISRLANNERKKEGRKGRKHVPTNAHNTITPLNHTKRRGTHNP